MDNDLIVSWSDKMTHGHPLSTAILLADAGASTNDLSNEREPLLGSMFYINKWII